jgi:NadR type nicotinamide-nucleotide adenylyltransferase
MKRSDREPGNAAVRRVAVIGAECVGKTTLCQALAEALPGLWVPEYLREFCDRAGRTPCPDEQPHILAAQIEHESREQRQAAVQGMSWLLCDSAPIVTAMYSQMLFDDDTLTGPALEHHRRYRFTLLLQPDLPWLADGIQRDGPAERARFHHLLERQLAAHGIAFARVHGQDADRLAVARRALLGGDASQPS